MGDRTLQKRTPGGTGKKRDRCSPRGAAHGKWEKGGEGAIRAGANHREKIDEKRKFNSPGGGKIEKSKGDGRGTEKPDPM